MINRKPYIEHETAYQLWLQMLYDICRFPLSVASDEQQFRKAMWDRGERLRQIADRWYRRYRN
jgi:hypothetical protein